MNLTQLARILSKEYGFSQALSTRILKTILRTIVSELKKGHFVRLRNFGTFRAKRSHNKVRAKFDDSDNIFKDLS